MPIKITPKQEKVLNHIRLHPLDTVEDIARAMFNSENTIKQDLKGLYRAYNVSGSHARRDLVKKIDA